MFNLTGSLFDYLINTLKNFLSIIIYELQQKSTTSSLFCHVIFQLNKIMIHIQPYISEMGYRVIVFYDNVIDYLKRLLFVIVFDCKKMKRKIQETETELKLNFLEIFNNFLKQ